jgi:hypothetical protein
VWAGFFMLRVWITGGFVLTGTEIFVRSMRGWKLDQLSDHYLLKSHPAPWVRWLSQNVHGEESSLR